MQLALWLNENFLVQEEIGVDSEGKLDARFFSLRGAGMLFIQMDTAGIVHVRCEDMELCGDIIQAVAEYLGIQDLSSLAEFPTDVDKLMSLIEKVQAQLRHMAKGFCRIYGNKNNQNVKMKYRFLSSFVAKFPVWLGGLLAPASLPPAHLRPLGLATTALTAHQPNGSIQIWRHPVVQTCWLV